MDSTNMKRYEVIEGGFGDHLCKQKSRMMTGLFMLGPFMLYIIERVEVYLCSIGKC